MNRVVSDMLHSDDDYLVLVGKLTLLFSEVEERFVHDALFLAEMSADATLKADAEPSRISRLRVLEKRDFLKRAIVETGRYYDLDPRRVVAVLNEFTNLHKIRRVVVHGSIRWSMTDERPVFVDNRGEAIPASHSDLANLNARLLSWFADYNAEMAAVMRDVLKAYEGLAERLLLRAKSPELQALFREFKEHVVAALG